MRPDLFLATIGRGSNGSNALEVTEDRAAVTAESQDNIINRVNNVSQYGPSWHYVPGIGVAGTGYAEVPGSALGDLAFTRASSKTRTNSAGVVETIASNVPPHDYRNADGTLSTFPRLNLEPQRTNSIRNSSMVGAVAGTPGTLPTNYTSNFRGFSSQVVGTGTENGVPYIDLRLFGTSTGGQVELTLEGNQQMAALVGQTWSLSSYLRIVSGSLPSGSQAGFAITERNSAGASLVEQAYPLTVTSSLQRFTTTRTLNQATTAFVNVRVIVTTSTTPADFTIRIAAPQMELGAFATTWVPTTTAAVTRLADTASKTGVSSLIGQTEGTVFLDLNYQAITGLSMFLSIRPNATNKIEVYRDGTSIFGDVIGNGVNVLLSRVSNPAGQYKIALAYKSGQTALYINGANVGTSSTAFSFTTSMADLFLNLRSGPTFVEQTFYNQAALFTTRLTNAQLAQLTTL